MIGTDSSLLEENQLLSPDNSRHDENLIYFVILLTKTIFWRQESETFRQVTW
jgi:hypothetical protein